MRYHEQRDANEKKIVAALKQAGATVQRINGGNGRPDLLVGFGGYNLLMEVKNPDSLGGKPKEMLGVAAVQRGGEYADLGEMCGKERARYLRVKQAEWFRGWKGRTPVIVMTPAEALAAIGFGGKDE